MTDKNRIIYPLLIIITILFILADVSVVSARKSYTKKSKIERSITLLKEYCPKYYNYTSKVYITEFSPTSFLKTVNSPVIKDLGKELKFSFSPRSVEKPNILSRDFTLINRSEMEFWSFDLFSSFSFINPYYRDFVLKRYWVSPKKVTEIGMPDYLMPDRYKPVFDDILKKAELMTTITGWLGTRYTWGGRSRKGVDCSNFTSLVMEESIGLRIPAGAAYQARIFDKIKKVDNLRFGDLIFFTGSNWRSSRIGHVGIYIGNGVFAHASSWKRRGVVYSHISQSNYLKRYRFGGRIYQKYLK